MRNLVCTSEGCVLTGKMAPVGNSAGGGGVLQEKNSYLIPLSSLIRHTNDNSSSPPVEEKMDTQLTPEQVQEVSRPKIPRRKVQTGRGVQQKYGSYMVPLSSVNQLASTIKPQGEYTDDNQESYLVLSVSKGTPAAKRQAAKRRSTSNNGPTANKRRQVGKGVVQQYEARSIPLKSKDRKTLPRKKAPSKATARRQVKQQSSSSSSESEPTCEKVYNRPNPKHEYVIN